MTPVVIDASAGAEMVANTLRGRGLARLIPSDAEGWVSEHFSAEVLAVLRRRSVVDRVLIEAQAAWDGSGTGICTGRRSRRCSMRPGRTDTT